MIKSHMRVIGVTGPSGSGKSFAAAVLARRGFKIIDADKAAKALYLPGLPLNRRLAGAFGPRVRGKNGKIDTSWLGREVFEKPISRGKLDAIMFPALMRRLRRDIRALEAAGRKRVVLDMAVLYQAGGENLADAVLLVEAPVSLRVARLRKNRGLSLKRAKAQAGAWKLAAQFRARADWVFVNDGPRDKFIRFLKRIS